jgi:uncharacterized phiE125 gp8 family phage protein
MGLVLFSGPPTEPLALQEVKDHLRVTETADDGLITTLITAARQHVDGKDGWLGRALITQTWDMKIDRFPAWCDSSLDAWRRAVAIRVPLPPLQSVTSVKYLDTAGAEQTLDPSKYVVHVSEEPGLIAPAFGQTWPTTRDQLEAVTVRFVAGYGASADAVPATLKLGLKALVAHFYENPEPVISGTISEKLPMHVDALLAPYRVWSA